MITQAPSKPKTLLEFPGAWSVWETNVEREAEGESAEFDDERAPELDQGAWTFRADAKHEDEDEDEEDFELDEFDDETDEEEGLEEEVEEEDEAGFDDDDFDDDLDEDEDE